MTPEELFSYFNKKLMTSNLFIKEENVSPLTENQAEDMILDENLMFHLICDVLDKYNGFITYNKPLTYIDNLNEINDIIRYAQDKSINMERALNELTKMKIITSDRVKSNKKEEIEAYEDLVMYLVHLKRELGE